MKFLSALAILLAAIAFGSCGGGGSGNSASSSTSSKTAQEDETPPAKKPKVEIPAGLPKGKLVFRDLKTGSGTTAKSGDEVTVQYVGVGLKTKTEFDSSWSHGEPLSFKLGVGEVIKGWDQAIKGMKVGGRREMVIPPTLAYGSEGTRSIAPNETLVFVVDLLAVEQGA